MLNQEHLSPEQELVQDLLTITQVFSARLYGLRNYRKSLKEAVHATLAHKIQLDPTTDPIRFFKQAVGTARFVLNLHWPSGTGNTTRAKNPKPRP
ncbi:hypothetical protein [Sulfobacillus harzensis]|uniref:Uncharacterized protein n=1 Tax=Sulfobacillus harzensis TaxID=2729629 RepID=A0A7Y0Q317_9FIRM|nr:hypothetical protein [Sulfobacillus harzensis]NMP22940.1 hypothetical protein [Sulfobacillus harzensis]